MEDNQTEARSDILIRRARPCADRHRLFPDTLGLSKDSCSQACIITSVFTSVGSSSDQPESWIATHDLAE